MADRHVVRVKVWGPLACFTRPEMKVERVSYPVMTPSAARGILEAILWKPEFHWCVRAIHVLKPIQFVSIRRNEVQKKIPTRTVKQWMKDPTKYKPFYADGVRTQRNTFALGNVAYVIEASVDLPEFSTTDPPVKYREMFERRVDKGQCFQRPYLGCREFAADFGPPEETDCPIEESMDLGLMLYDIDYGKVNRPLFFTAKLHDGVLTIDRETVRGLEEVAPT